MTQTQASSAAKISTYLMFIVLIVLGLSIVSLFSSFYAYVLGNDIVAGYLLIIGFLALALSAYVLFQSRRRAVAMKIEVPKVMTTIECLKCSIKTTREYQRGDFVYKELEACTKCNDKQLITAIYKEVKEKEKTFNV